MIEKIRQGQLKQLFSKVLGKWGRCMMNPWDHVEYPRKHWWDIPEVMERWNLLITGDAKVDYFSYFMSRYFSGRESLKALSLGCGTGHREIDLVRLGKFERIDAIDISKARIEHARETADKNGCNGRINYIVGDVYDYRVSDSFYDLILVEQSLHHFSPLDQMLQRINDFLKDDGYFIFNEFIGPSRFQWDDRQLEVVNAILSILPVKYRIHWKSGTIKRRVHRRGRLGMILYDRTEAVESSKIMPLIKDIFDVVDIKEYGGTVLQLLFSDIAHNFLSKDEETQRLLRLCFELEDLFLESGVLKNDFVVGICRKCVARERSTDKDNCV